MVELLEPRFAIRIVRQWEEVLQLSRMASCAVVGVAEIEAIQFKQNLFQYCVYPTLRPLVLVTDFTRDNAEALIDLCIDEVVWFSNIRSDLLVSVQRAQKREYLNVLGRTIESNEKLPPQLARALSAACTSPHPIRTQRDLLTFALAHRSTLYRQWRSAAGEVKIKTFLEWIILLRACIIRESVSSWADVVEALQIPRSVLAGISHRLTNSRLSSLDLLRVEKRFRSTKIFETLLSKDFLHPS